jgi:two-component system nitrate/nitrite response regulator NarL
MTSSDTQGTISVLFASDDNTLVDRYTNFLSGNFPLVLVRNPSETLIKVREVSPDLVLLDPAIFPEKLAETVSGIGDCSSRIRIVVIEDKSDRAIDQMALFKHGVHGFCADDISCSLLVKAVHAVCNGETWFPRTLISKLIADLANKSGPNNRGSFLVKNKAIAHLTPRELEVAQMVHLGGNNKLIARELDISERTVKAHLSAIFRKLDIENRLHLALFFNKLS